MEEAKHEAVCWMEKEQSMAAVKPKKCGFSAAKSPDLWVWSCVLAIGVVSTQIQSKQQQLHTHNGLDSAAFFSGPK